MAQSVRGKDVLILGVRILNLSVVRQGQEFLSFLLATPNQKSTIQQLPIKNRDALLHRTDHVVKVRGSFRSIVAR